MHYTPLEMTDGGEIKTCLTQTSHLLYCEVTASSEGKVASRK